jgi:predicted RNase H-like HicB family nuclease
MSSHRYAIRLHWSEADQAVVAEVPELPGCIADGSTYAEALANVELVIEEWIATARELGRSVPEPRTKLSSA